MTISYHASQKAPLAYKFCRVGSGIGTEEEAVMLATALAETHLQKTLQDRSAPGTKIAKGDDLLMTGLRDPDFL